MFKELGLKNLGDYHDLYAQIHIILLEYVLENFKYKCIEINEHDLAHFSSGSALV